MKSSRPASLLTPPPSFLRVHAVLVLLTAALVPWYHRVQTDDPYITFRYARNLAETGRLVYNQGEPVLGTTSPLHAALLALPGLFTERYDIAASVLSGAALATLACLAFTFLDRLGHGRAGRAAALLTILNPLLADALGFETNLFLALVLGAFTAALRERFTWAALLAAVAVLARGDGLVPAGLLLGHLLFTQPRRARVPVLAFGIVVAAWALLSTTLYGSPFPNTLAAKRALGESGLFRPFARGGLRLAWIYVTHSPLYLAFLPPLAAGLFRLRSADRRLQLLVAWPALIVAAYVAMGVPSAYNYFASLVPVGMVVTGLGLTALSDRILGAPMLKSVPRATVAPALLLPLLAAQGASLTVHRDATLAPRHDTYREAGRWLDTETQPDASVALVEIGIVGYYSRRRVVDVCGLVTPSVLPHIARVDVSWPVRTLRPDYVLLHDPPWPAFETPIAGADWFRASYKPVRSFDGAEPYRLTAYRRIAGSP